jgi:hypothetical protein
MNLSQFCDLRPFVYHLTASSNLPRIMREGRLFSAAALLDADGASQLETRDRRPQKVRIQCGSDSIVLRDQQPLHHGNCTLAEGWTFENLVEYLNSYVFFWSGDAETPPAMDSTILRAINLRTPWF